jgi:aspartyl/asparaginyl beta-hydroxylase (cupin superfamily)
MGDGLGDVRALMAEASRLRQAGKSSEAAALLRPALSAGPGHAAAWNLLGIIELDLGDPQAAARSIGQAIAIDPAPPLWLNLARAQRAAGARKEELNSLDEALSRDAYYLPAILAKGEVLVALGREDQALELYRLMFEGLPADAEIPPGLAPQLEQARALLDRRGDEKMAVFAKALDEIAATGADLGRARAYAEQRAGKRKVYQQRPTGSHFPYLPAIEFFDRDLFPWFEELERQTPAIREEILSLWAEEGEDDERFRPYVAYPPGTPANQWAELNHSARWSAWFFWENGVRNEANCARCPRTAAALDQVPMLDIPGKSPTAMFSILRPRTRIPPHTGTSNTRTTIHLALVVPPGCGFRVGAETRKWREGEAWAFDDTIEHEAWNDSDERRAILIIDGWNPLLTEAEREVVRRIG